MTDAAAAAAPDDAPSPERQRRAVRGARIALVVVGLVLVLGAGRTLVSRAANARALESASREHAVTYVKTTLPKAGGAARSLALPGTLQGYVQSPIAARASGYLKRWTKDIGARVQAGELLAEIETPEIDQQLVQAVAAREQAAAGLQLARSTVARWEGLRQKDVVSQQELDERRSNLQQAQANLASAEANVQRLRQLEGFKRVVAPFAGVITRRNVDVGDLIDAGGAASRPLFLLSQTDRLRVYVNVPQSAAPLVKPGQAVTVTQSELPGRPFAAQVARTAGAIDAATRTMQVEVALDNADGALLPGAYVQVDLKLPAGTGVAVPTNALLFRPAGTMVALVDGQGRVSLRKVDLGRNTGDTVQVLAGLRADERIVLNPPDSLADGDVVAVAPEAAASGAQKASPGARERL